MKEWFVKCGDKVSQFDNICEVQSDKASATITSRYDGIIKKLYYNLDESCLVGSTLVDIEVEEEEDKLDKLKTIEPVIELSVKANERTPFEINSQHDKILTSPSVRKIAKENNINLSDVSASGKDGRIMKEDILSYLEKTLNKVQLKNDESLTTKNNTQELNNILSSKKYVKQMWKSMTESLTIPTFVYSDECNVSELMQLRYQVKKSFETKNLNLTYMPFFIKATSQALLQFPVLNSLINEEKPNYLDIKTEHNISIAMDTPDGLIVPNIKNVQNLNIVDITKELNRLQELGRTSSITVRDLNGGTFSLSNIGIVGGTCLRPIIFPPQIVLGAFGKIQRLPRFDKLDNVIAANILTVSWAADHRVIDGTTIARFSNLWKHYIENPSHLLIGI